MNTSESLIAAAKALKAGAAEHIVALALRADGFSEYKVQVMLRWCVLHNKRTAYEQGTIESDQGSIVEDSYNLYGDR